ncbi:hypothetical protein ACFFTM_11845 [Pseudoduganella plicata]|uniref:Uncharacterized protein n=1 Tax=Pseudoduganella plicata TaxID=321984 RepID=A0A4P7BCP8_9BURK|nr:hypothetical protein [Pseudoduganella plicata]QBQ35883.1 hypothetical protein E1742_06735 [Pseudoduganella plicata]GGY94345.1 hypothetical protein GCM10007388_29430 [Pseudoduganella plicata]
MSSTTDLKVFAAGIAELPERDADDEFGAATSQAYLIEVEDAVPQSDVLEQLYEALRTLGITARVSPVARDGRVTLVTPMPALVLDADDDDLEAERFELDARTVEEQPSTSVTGTGAALQRGEALIASMVRQGSLINGETLASAWGITRQALDKARERGELFSVRMGRQHYYPVAALSFLRRDFESINRSFHPDIAAGTKLIFFNRKHGSLGGKTVAESADRLTDILRLAAGWERI